MNLEHSRITLHISLFNKLYIYKCEFYCYHQNLRFFICLLSLLVASLTLDFLQHTAVKADGTPNGK